jgi:primosomal protein N''
MEVKCICESSVWDTLANVVALIISLLNFIYLVYIRCKDKSEEKQEKIKKYNYAWFEMIKVSERVNNLNNLLKKIKDDYKNISDYEEDSLEKRRAFMSEHLIEADNMFLSEKSSFNYLLTCIDLEKNAHLSNLYNELQEKYIDIYNAAILKNDISFDLIMELISKISEMYYQIGYELIK